jgi:periplasmic protein CpxP/Spy
MSDIQNTVLEPSAPQPQSPTPCGGRRRKRRTLFAGVAALVLLAGAAVSAHAWAGRHEGMWGEGGPIRVERIERHVDHLLQKVDATSDQTAKVNAIIEAAAKDIDPLRKEIGDTRKQALSLLSAPQIDRGAIEKLRSDRMAAMDKMSQRMSTAVADAADVLSPEQRQKLAHDLESFRPPQRPD